MTQKTPIYKILSEDQWASFEKSHVFEGSPIDIDDGYIHMSAATELQGTLDKHYTQGDPVIILAVNPDGLGDALKWEVSRGGAEFPHYYAPLGLSHILWRKRIRPNDQGQYNVKSLLGGSL